MGKLLYNGYDMKKKYQQGQAGLIVLLIAVVLLTVGVSVMLRSTGDVSLSTQEEASSRVFNAAEAGIEKGLGTLTSGSLNVGDASVNYDVVGNNFLETVVEEGHVAEVDLSGYAGTMTVQWYTYGASVACDNASVVLSLFSDTNTVTRYGLTPEGCTRDDFIVASGGTPPYQSKYEVTVLNAKIARIRTVYAEANIQVTGTGTFPNQSHTITSTATSTTGDEARAIQVERSLPAAPAIFDYVLFSGTDI